MPLSKPGFLLVRCYASMVIGYGISICLCVTCVLCIKMGTGKCFVQILLPPDKPIILDFCHWGLLFNSNTRGWENWAIFDQQVGVSQKQCEIGHSCYRSRTRNYTQAIKWWHFRWPWVTPTPGFEVTLQFEGKYLANGACYSHSYYRTRIGSHSRATKWCHFRWPWVTPTPSFKVTL